MSVLGDEEERDAEMDENSIMGWEDGAEEGCDVGWEEGSRVGENVGWEVVG